MEQKWEVGIIIIITIITNIIVITIRIIILDDAVHCPPRSNNHYHLHHYHLHHYSDHQVLYTAHQEVVEERCELEEAENDSRLRAQKSVVMEMITRMMMMMDDDG